MTHLPSPSFWWDQLGGPAVRHPELVGTESCDVAVVGAGYTGLWTAHELRRLAPDLDIVVLEASALGFGASGRNGGWLSGLITGPRRAWAERCGRESVAALARALGDAVDHVARFCDEEGVDCDLRKDGALMVATDEPQVKRLHAMRDEELAWGASPADWQLLEPDEVAMRVRVDGALLGLWTPHCARIQPAKLARGLGEVVARGGTRIFERSPVTGIGPGRVATARGEVRARWVVRATEGFTAGLPGQRRAMLPMRSAMIVTEPLPARVWDEIGWDGAETLHDLAYRYSYLQRTADGRIAIGGRGSPYRFASRTDRGGEIGRVTVAELRRKLGELFPAAADAPIARGWSGVLGVTRDWSPRVGVDHAAGYCWAGGYAGDGVTATNLAARIVCDLVLGRDTDLVRLPWVDHPERRWEPEPLRWLGVQSVYGLYRAADAMERRTGRTSPLGRLAGAIAGH